MNQIEATASKCAKETLRHPRFSRWLGEQGLGPYAIRSQHCAHYLRCRARGARIHRSDEIALGQFLELLRREGVSAAEQAPARRLTAAGRCIEGFERYLRDERALSQASLTNYVPFIRQFLADRFGDRPVKLASLCANDITGFVRAARQGYIASERSS